MTNRDPVTRADAADRIWAVVEPTGDYGGLRRVEICDQTHLTRSQFENGKVGIREHKALDEGKCFIYDGDVYAVTRDPGRCAKALVHQLKAMDGQLRRLRSSSYGPLDEETRGRDAALTFAVAKIESMLAEMIILREIGFSASAKRFEEVTGKR